MIVQVVYEPTEHALNNHYYRGEPQLHTFDDVNEFSNSNVNFEVTENSFGEIVWGNEGDAENAVFPRHVRPGDDKHRAHVFVDFSLGGDSHKANYTYVRAAHWVNSRGILHFLILDAETQAFLMTDEGKTIRRF